ncbi:MULTISPECIES: ABC transporter permease [unclassified Shinella]|jgi:iron(III) transport system permease protein|uniref:ABC transporter permease n=1 Tax=unclassified Shinella TaxID=2643062 RepID=UPI0003C557A1|nr:MULTISPECIES: iron ABC transporter permease [unclassified Shinella]MCA0320465.1 iron ABC transporter permease [Pseudomonadota bacterium]MCA0338932.1 iron ABC transporter permease [Pseudomonadota bacterium]MCO5152125.1 iron ABC transporter permease [Shinella sp.]MDC7266677.1 iron ABC transporter permease [Shinella sp. HY16]MDC7273574.1 iron ABC transporter permease [Shinella sp. YZ44]
MSTHAQAPAALDLSKAAAEKKYPARMPRHGNAGLYRRIVIGLLALAVLAPVGLIVYQSFLTAAFFSPRAQFGLDAYKYVFTDRNFYKALATTAIFSFGMVAIAVPLGGLLAFLITRTDIKGKRLLEILVLVPMFISSIVLAFGYTVSVGPTGFVSLFIRGILGFVPWNIYSLPGMILIAGLSHVPHVYLYVSSAMRNLPSDLEEAARTTGASIWQVSRDVTLPMVLPALIFAAALNILLGFETFGIPLVLGDPNGIMVLTTYIYKLTTLFGTPTYQLMAVVAVVLILITLPLVWMQRKLLRNTRKYAAMGGKGARVATLKLGTSGQVIALSIIGFWLFVSVVLPIGGIAVRAFVDAWGEGVNLWDQLTFSNFDRMLEVPSLVRGIINTVLLSVVGGAAAVGIYLMVGLAGHRNWGLSNTVLDYIVLLPRALPGLVIGLAFFWVFLFVPLLTPLRPTLVSLFIAYVVVGLSYGLRLLQGTLIQVAPELEESARTTGATIGRTWKDVVIPIVRPGLAGAWALIMIIFLREYATGVYLMGAGTEVIGSLMVSLLQTGAMNTIAALSLISIVLTGAGLALALRLGAKIHD